jgi:hypothetical protein
VRGSHARCGRSYSAAARRSGQKQHDAGSTRSARPAAVVGRFGWRRSRWKGRQSYTLCEQEWRTGAAARYGGPASDCAGMPDVFLQCMCVSRGSSTREQENLEVRGRVGIANQSGPIGFFLESTTSNSSYPSPIIRARPQHLKKAHEPSYRASSDPFAETSSPWQSQLSSPRVTVRKIPPAILRPLQSPDKLFRHPRNLLTVEHFSSSILFATGIHFPPILLHYQSYPKVCPDSLNLPNAGDSFAGISSLSSCSLFSPTRDFIALI